MRVGSYKGVLLAFLQTVLHFLSLHPNTDIYDKESSYLNIGSACDKAIRGMQLGCSSVC